MKQALALLFLFSSLLGLSQIRPNNGVAESTPHYYALKNAKIYSDPGKSFKGTILIKDGKIEKVGPFVSVPNGAVEIDYSGMTILPAFIELNTDLGIPEAKSNSSERPQLETSKDGAFYWNESIHPEVNAHQLYVENEKQTTELLKKGFGFALTHQKDGIARGQGAFVALSAGKDPVLKAKQNASFFSFQKGVSRQTYPSSQMGAIALMRQAFYDAVWYADNSDAQNLSLDALNQQRKETLVFDSRDKFEIIRAAKIAAEFDFNFVYLGSGNEYQLADEIAALNTTVVLPLNFPDAYDVQNPYLSRQIPLSDLKHWEMAPLNASVLNNKGVSICLSSDGTKKADDFWENLRSAIRHGLPEESAIEALTLNPAKLIGMDHLVGSIEPGKLASFIVYDHNPLKKKAEIVEGWSNGTPLLYNRSDNEKVSGTYNILADGHKFPIEFSGSSDKLKASVTYSVRNEKNGELTEKKVDANVEVVDNDITIQFIVHGPDLDGSVSLHGKITGLLGIMEGNGLLPNGQWVKWSAIKSVKTLVQMPEKKDKKVIEADTTVRIWHPQMAYGFEQVPEREVVLIKNATLWTNEAEGIIEKGSVLIVDGKITHAGPGAPRPPAGARVIDAEGKHVTSGIIDEHSHIAISRGVNEGGQAISAEVSIGDVVNPDDINIYRQLSGGVTAAQLLHGSANPIGGQSALIKLMWGHSADEMLIDNAPKFIKFALGENVKQSNWGDYNTVRFPQTRMGVEQIYYDGFMRARQYRLAQQNAKDDPSLPAPRVDLELEVLAEILEKNRFITCHSYIQSEINMLMHVADSMGFKLNTFTHILEGYKVADKMAAHGAGGSTFSDWWAYKYEVNDAIPYNAKLMHDQGVVVAINSDDAEMGRRLNQEAAKAVKYGGMSEEDAWKMVTLNPAKLLHLDDRMGSLKVGKDADIVIWTDHPLSISAIVEYTIVDGKVLYDHERDASMRVKNQEDKARILSKMLESNQNGGKKKSFFKRKKGHYHCDTLGEETTTEENHH